MPLVRTILVELGLALLLLGCYSEAELCIGEGTPCKQKEPAGCTKRAVCNNTEISIGEDESGCKQCQKPCSEKIYIMYSSLIDKTPATGWYTYEERNNVFHRHIESEGISFFLRKKDYKWTLIEIKIRPSYEQREITQRIELSFKNDMRTRISLDNFGIDEDERKFWKTYDFKNPSARGKNSQKYEERLIVFCPGKCLCKKIHVTSPVSNYCFVGSYQRMEANNTTEQLEQESNTKNAPIANRKKRSYNFPGFKQASDQSDNYNSKQNNDQWSDSSKMIANANPTINLDTTGEQNNDQSAELAMQNDSSAPNEEDYQNWRQESYISTSENYGEEPFGFIFDEEYQVWFVGRGDDIAAVIPEASPCPEMIQKQQWFVINEQFKLKLGTEDLEKVLIRCIP